MRPRDVPVVGTVVEAGADDRVFDALLLAGPVVIIVVAALGRSPLTVALAAAYIVAFVTYTLSLGVRS